MAAYPSYDSYKDSGEGWIEDIPAHWEVRKLKQLFQEKKHRSNLALNCGSISFGEVVEKDDERVPLATKASYQEVCKGEFLVNPLNLNYDLKSLRIGLSGIDVVVSAGYLVLQAKGGMDKQYFKYLLHRYDVAYMKLLGSGVRQTISFNHIANSILIAPPLAEQRAITVFLDDKCANIDGAVKIKEDQIALLRERRQIIIQDAVTRGLNPAVPMKDSGIDWIGRIPAHWVVRRSKFVFTQRKEFARKDDVQLSATQAYGVIPQEEFEELVGRRVVKIYTNLEKRKHVELDDFVISMRSFQGGLERAWATGCIRSSYIVLRPLQEICPTFFGYLFKSPRYIKALQTTASFIRDGQDLNFENFAMVELFLPPISEQREIAEEIKRGCEKIENGIAIKKRQIAALNEYRTSLINAAVTGKIKVI
ncbi:restriction endonuclease subunit S [Janthinobacterium sp.]|uniref:restriction endonuclease subunit S n=1 Tax=Janthinobacterium sp. TaxID=1871054 RepID=UPI00262CEE85|nr:restriction endonuclease subunit S [Janthinobacterium sp.]